MCSNIKSWKTCNFTNLTAFVSVIIHTCTDLFEVLKRKNTSKGVFVNCGKEGIRTPDTFPYTRFPSVRLKPLGHLSKRVTKLRNAF